jgi:hypothetical protein
MYNQMIIILFLLLFSTPAMAEPPPTFDASRAFRDLERQCAFGPRNPGSVGHQQCREWLVKSFADSSWEVWQQGFDGLDPVAGETHRLTNIVARMARFTAGRRDSLVAFSQSRGKTAPSTKPLLLCAHWDTRPRADQDPDTAKREQPILGANDGASGVAVLLEVARLLAQNPPPRTVIIALFDGEDMGRSTYPEEFCLGARYWAAHPIPEPVKEAILLDMVGDADMEIPVEPYSEMNAPALRQQLWDIAGRLGLSAFTGRMGPGVEDDHLPLQQAGIKAVDLIDFDYRYWHTTDDTPDKCSAESLGQVGRLLIEYIYNE